MSDWTPGTKAARLLGSVGTPLLYAAVVVFLGFAVPRFEVAFLPGLTAKVSAGAALAILSSIASGMLPLTGLVFSLAFVMVILLLVSVVFFVLLVEKLTMLQISASSPTPATRGGRSSSGTTPRSARAGRRRAERPPRTCRPSARSSSTAAAPR